MLQGKKTFDPIIYNYNYYIRVLPFATITFGENSTNISLPFHITLFVIFS